MPVHLPTEIWRIIFRQATYHPGLETEWDDDAEARKWSGRDFEAASVDLESQRTKRAIVHVCSIWREIGLEFLWESIHIPSAVDYTQIRNLIEVFMASASYYPQVRDGPSHGHGGWVRRISSSCDFLSSVDVHHLFNLLDHCRNLRAFIARSQDGDASAPVPVQRRLSQVLESRFQCSLRRLELYINLTTLDEAPIISAESMIPHLEGLTSLGITMRNDIPDFAQNRSFNCVTSLTLHLPSLLSIPLPWSFPRLQNLVLNNIFDGDVQHLASFLIRHQDALLYLRVSSPVDEDNAVPALLPYTPSLKRLTVDYLDLNDVYQWCQPNTILPHLTILAGVERVRATNAGLQEALAGPFPNLKVVRAMHKLGPVSLRDSSIEWIDTTNALRENDVRLEDREGKILGYVRS